MNSFRFLRITGVRTDDAGSLQVSYFRGDAEVEALWPGSPPSVGDLYETDPKDPSLPPKFVRHSTFEGSAARNDAIRWRRPVGEGLSRMAILQRRHLIQRAVRAYFDQEGFIEFEAPLLINGTTPDTAVESFSVEGRYLATSTEYQLKRLAVGGFEKLYSLTKNFRLGDNEGRFRNPEFTMLEWGRAGETMEAIENDAEMLVTAALEGLGIGPIVHFEGRDLNFGAPWKRMSVLDAIRSVSGVLIKDFELESCLAAAEALGLSIRDEWRSSQAFVFSNVIEAIQAKLGLDGPLFLNDWPLYQTTSAEQKPGTKLAERSQLFIGGIEISDGFGGLADPVVQRQFFEAALEGRRQNGQWGVTLDEAYLTSMTQGAPYGAGMALGFDRLIMLLTGVGEIRHVLPFAWDEL